jgi:hypothetical protein
VAVIQLGNVIRDDEGILRNIGRPMEQRITRPEFAPAIQK